MAPECLGATKKEGGSNVRVSMAMAVPVTPRGGRRVKGHGLQRKVQLSLWRPRHLAEVKSYIHRKKKRRKGWGGEASWEDPSAFILKEEEEEEEKS